MLTLYHCAGSRSFRALWMLEELGLDYALKLMPFPPRFRQENYLEVNPLGTVPAFTDGAVTMTESSAICHYLATKYGPSSLAVSPDEPGYGGYLNFLFMGEATLTFPQTIYLRYARFEPEERRQKQVADDYTQWFASRLKAAVTLLGPRYAAADRFTAADISVAYAIKLANAIGLAAAIPQRAQAYWQDMRTRPGLQRAEAAEISEHGAAA